MSAETEAITAVEAGPIAEIKNLFFSQVLPALNHLAQASSAVEIYQTAGILVGFVAGGVFGLKVFHQIETNDYSDELLANPLVQTALRYTGVVLCAGSGGLIGNVVAQLAYVATH
jgi:hypothetical protein